MREKTKGTPRKRPYDVKRKLARAGVKYDICDGTFESPTKGTCIFGAYMKEKGLEAKSTNVPQVAKMLGLSTSEAWAVINGFDDDEGTEKNFISPSLHRWFDVGQELRDAFLR